MNNTLDMERVRMIAEDPASPAEARRYARALLAQSGRGSDPYTEMRLDAAATPITPDPALKPRSMRDTMTARRAAVGDEPMTPGEMTQAFESSNAWLRLPEQQAARDAQRAQMVSEITGMPVQEAAMPRSGSPRRMQMIDGVEVPVIEGPAGQKMYRFGDIKAAQAAQREAVRLAQVREANRRDMEQYGYGTSDPSEEQLAARAKVTQERMGQAAGGRQEDLRIRRLAESLGVTEAQAAAAYEAAVDRANLTPEGIGRAMTVARRALLADSASGAVDKRAEQKDYARGVITRRAQAQNNPMEYLGRDDVDDWQKMVMARRLVGSSGFTPIEMQAQQNQILNNVAQQLMRNPALLMGDQRIAAMQAREDAEKKQAWRGIAGAIAEGGGGNGRRRALMALQRNGADPVQAKEIVDEFFAPDEPGPMPHGGMPGGLMDPSTTPYTLPTN